MQFELHLTRQAEEIYVVLPEEVKCLLNSASLHYRNDYIQLEALAFVSAQLTWGKQEPQETIDTYAQAFEHLFGKSYSQHQSMNMASRATLK